MRWPRRARSGSPGWRRALLLVVAWLVVAVPVAGTAFLHGSRSTVLAGHDAVVRPSVDGYATLDLGPYLPNLRYPTDNRLGARIDLGKTTATSYPLLIRRYAYLAGQPEGQIRKVRAVITDLLLDSAALGALVGLAGPGLVLLVGRRRWGELLAAVTVRRSLGLMAVVVVLLLVLGRPWTRRDAPVERDTWQALPSALPELTLPRDARPLQIESGLVTSSTRRLVESAVDSYRHSLVFYRRLADAAPTIAPALRRPGAGERVGLLVSDRHDNVGMDPVARAIADAGHATFLLDAGDDTSTGGAWEAFSLESLDQAFRGVDERFAIAGNHDNGDVVVAQERKLGFTSLDGRVVDGPGGLRILGASDVRSSGLGSWRDERGISFAEQERRLADLACRHDADGDRVDVLMVHDADSGDQALARGCVGVVLAGHLHEQVGPDQVTGSNRRTGWTYTNGTTGGAAYAVALGSKLRRDAEVTLVTVGDGEVRGLQPVTISTLGQLHVEPYVDLTR